MPLRSLAAALLIAAPALDAQEAAARAVPDTTVVVKSSGSVLEFLPARLSLRTGLRVKLTYTNEGTLPHNLVLAKDEADLDELSTEAYGAGDTGFVPMGLKDKLIAYTALVSPNQTVEVEFVVPAPGDYPFICLFPGHANMMVGTLRALR